MSSRSSHRQRVALPEMRVRSSLELQFSSRRGMAWGGVEHRGDVVEDLAAAAVAADVGGDEHHSITLCVVGIADLFCYGM